MADLVVELTVDDQRWTTALGDPQAVVEAIMHAAAEGEPTDGAVVSVLLADDAAVRTLNARFRGQDKPTNVLSFPAPEAFAGLLGDVILAYDTVAAEAANQRKAFRDHARHLLAHGLLHLLGYDHENDADAAIMEGRERTVLAALGAPDPYADHD